MIRAPGKLTYQQLLHIPEEEQRVRGLIDELGEWTKKAIDLLDPTDLPTLRAEQRARSKADAVMENLAARQPPDYFLEPPEVDATYLADNDEDEEYACISFVQLPSRALASRNR